MEMSKLYLVVAQPCYCRTADANFPNRAQVSSARQADTWAKAAFAPRAPIKKASNPCGTLAKVARQKAFAAVRASEKMRRLTPAGSPD
jgi:hypothetical protein